MPFLAPEPAQRWSVESGVTLALNGEKGLVLKNPKHSLISNGL